MTSNNLREINAACRVNNAPRSVFDERARMGDMTPVNFVAGRLVVDADKFRARAMRVRAEQSAGAEGGCCNE